MKKTILLLVFALLAAGCIGDKNPRACIRDTCFKVEIANTNEERAQGLGDRASLEQDKGMLFVFEKEGLYRFWMKNTLIPLDIIWMDKEGRIVYIERQAQPCRQDPCQSINPGVISQYVLELNGGTCDRLSISVGDKVQVEY
jgi:uncharacterized membrane protein (UPF0127 family)